MEEITIEHSFKKFEYLVIDSEGNIIAKCPYKVNKKSYALTKADKNKAYKNALLISKSSEMLEMFKNIIGNYCIDILKQEDALKIREIVKKVNK